MGLADLIRASKQNLLVTHRLESFLTEHGADFPVPPDVQAWAANEIVNGGGPRPGWLRSSGLHFCHRRQVYAYNGEKQAKPDPKLSQIFADGRYRHLRWQVMLLSAGIIDKVEVPWRIPEIQLSGTMDGFNSTEKWGLELKGIHDNGYRYVATFDKPKDEHLLQVGAYFLGNPEIERFSLIYENKNSNDYREFVIERDESRLEEVRDLVTNLNTWLTSGTLPPILDECRDKTGKYRSCPFATICVDQRPIRISK